MAIIFSGSWASCRHDNESPCPGERGGSELSEDLKFVNFGSYSLGFDQG